ncbi:MAG: cytochrome c biosis protein CcmG, thiol:disulfide interchange protein DsbE [Actinomycetota bacterium]|jgi:cytochrome c biogenesis protein CcmG/thiol:disulfide interchange protein DsbE
MKKHVGLFSAVALAVLLGGLVFVLATSEPSTNKLAKSPLLGKIAPPLTGESVTTGDRVDVVDDAGSWVVVNFFATWCVPCQAEHDDLIAFSNAHAATGDASVLSVVFDDESSKVKAFFRKNGGDWPVVNDTEGRIATDFGVTGVPESYLIDPNGIVRAKIVGGVVADKLEALLAQAKAQ